MNSPMYAWMEEFQQQINKLNKGREVFNEIQNIDIGKSPKELVWSLDKNKLYRYQRETPATCKTPVLITYALINRYYMMDLQPDLSLVKKLLEFGLDIYVLDTGYPTRNERYLTMDDYINYYIDSAVDFIRETHGLASINLMGVCQGGTFATIYSAIHPEKVKNLTLLVTPIDFESNDGLLFRWARDLEVEVIVDGYGGLIPGPFLDAGFQMLKPMLKVRKQKNLMNMLDNSDRVMNFMRMEKWINDLPDQSGECYRQFIKDLYQANKLAKNELVVGKHKVDLKKLTAPLLNIYATEDHLVPPAHTIPLNDLVGSKDKQLYAFPGGHIGVFTGRRSQAELSPTIFQWLKDRD